MVYEVKVNNFCYFLYIRLIHLVVGIPQIKVRLSKKCKLDLDQITQAVENCILAEANVFKCKGKPMERSVGALSDCKYKDDFCRLGDE